MDIDKHVHYSVKKYQETYHLLEDYDKSTQKSSNILGNAERLQDDIRPFLSRN